MNEYLCIIFTIISTNCSDLLPPLGVCSAQRIKIAMIADGNHTSASCRDSGKGGVVGIFDLFPFNEPHPLSLALLDSSPTGEPRPLLPPLGEVPR